MTSHYRHRRTATPATAFPAPVEPGEIVVNSANRQLVVGDADATQLGTPLLLLAVRYFDPRAQYATGDMVVQGGALYRAKAAINPGAFSATQWDLFSSDVTIKAYADAGDAAVTTAFQAADTTLQTNINGKTDKAYVDAADALKADKTYVDAGDAPKADKTYVDSQNTAQDATITGKVAKAGDTMTGILTLQSADPNLVLRKAASGNGNYIAGYKGALARWSLILGDANAESSGDAGSDFDIYAFDDAGNLKYGVITISRATGLVQFPRSTATAAEYLANANPTKMLTAGAVWAAAAPVNPGAVGGFQPDFNNGIDFFWTLISATSTLYNPLNAKPGQKGIIYLQQDATGNRKITTWGSQYYFAGGLKPMLSIGPNQTDSISYAVVYPNTIFCTFAAGFA